MSIFEIALIASCTTLFLNYCIGKPGSEFSHYEIFSSYTIWLSKRRLNQIGLLREYMKQYHESLNHTNKHHEVVSLKKDFDRILYNAAEPFFTWERAVGMCPICTGFWIALFISLLTYSNGFFGIIEIIVISHVITRVINKIL